MNYFLVKVTKMQNIFVIKTSRMLYWVYTLHAFLIMHEYIRYKRRHDNRKCADTKKQPISYVTF